MELKIADRLNVTRLLPVKGDITTQLTAKDIRDKVEPTLKETKDVGLVQIPVSPGKTTWQWDTKKDKPKNIDFEKAELRLLKDCVKYKDDEKEITPDMVDLCVLIRDAKIDDKPKPRKGRKKKKG